MSKALSEPLARLRHDLGRYVSLQVRWLGDDPDPDALREALAADLLQTRRGPSGAVDALAVWGELRPALAELAGDPDFARIEVGMAGVARAIDGLRAGDLDRDGVRRGAAAAAEVADACRALWARARGG